MSEPVGKEASLREYISRDLQRPRGNWIVTPLYNMGAIIYHGLAAVRAVPNQRLFPADAFVSSPYEPGHVEITDVSKDEQGNLVVSVVGMDPNKVFRAVFDGKEWWAGTDEASATSTP